MTTNTGAIGIYSPTGTRTGAFVSTHKQTGAPEELHCSSLASQSLSLCTGGNEQVRTMPSHPGGNPGANRKSISHKCYRFEVAIVWEFTKETIVLPLGCLQGGSYQPRVFLQTCGSLSASNFMSHNVLIKRFL